MVCHFLPARRLAALAAGCGLPPDEIRRRIWESGLDHDFDRGLFDARGMYEQVRGRLGLRMGYERFRAAWATAFVPDPDVLDVVDEVRRRARAGLLTDNGPVLLDTMPVLFPEVARRFEPLLFSCELGALKPEPALFKAALARLGEPPERVLLIDDSPRVIEGAHAYGLPAVLFTGAGRLAAEIDAWLGPNQ